MVFAQTKISPRQWDAKNSLGFCDRNGLPNLDQKNRSSVKEKINLLLMDFHLSSRVKKKKKKKSKR